MKKYTKFTITNNSVSLAGEFAVLSQLALRGFDTNMTLGNTKGVDILASNPKTGRMYKIEVKTNYRNSRNKPTVSKLFGKSVSGWIMNIKHEEKIPNLFYCFVNIGKNTNQIRFFLVPSRVVAKYVRAQHQLWLNVDRRHKDSPMRIFRICLKGEKYRKALMPVPIAEKYEDNWSFLE